MNKHLYLCHPLVLSSPRIYSQYSLDESQQYTNFMTAFYAIVNQSGRLCILLSLVFLRLGNQIQGIFSDFGSK